MEVVPAILMGISLAACAGLRAFLPLLAAGLAVRMEWWHVQPWLQWMGSTEALVTFGLATLLEVLSDKVPILDHALDVFHSFARPVAGALVAMGAFYQGSPLYATALGIILGAPLAGGFHFARAGTRVASTATTGGVANPVLSSIEDMLAATGVLFALIAPIVTFLALLALAVVIFRWKRGRRPVASRTGV